MIEGKFIKPMLIGKVKEDVKHQGIGGKRIIIEREFNSSDILDQPINKMNIACINFITRRMIPDDMKVYYGHVNGLGYFIGEDELVGAVTTATEEEIKEIW